MRQPVTCVTKPRSTLGEAAGASILGEALKRTRTSARPLRRSPRVPRRAANEERGDRHNSRMPRPIEALIHTDALAHNIGRAREAAPDARVWAVVQANAYGHRIE